MSMLLALAFAALCIYIAYCDAMELFIAWYSGCEDQITPTMWWLAVTRSAAALVVAVTTLAMAWTARG
jgi:hypothetical protein